jgi:hypothetical protein
VIGVDLAVRLREAGLPWTPVAGDRFVVPHRRMDDQVFLVSEMTIEVHDAPGGRLIRFNGTTEWALDSIEEGEVVWLPREDQLRAQIGDRFRRLEVTADGVLRVVVLVDGQEQQHDDQDAEAAYGRALLALLETV